jgi:hypothetical protein
MARMPSTRAQPLNPRAAPPPGARAPAQPPAADTQEADDLDSRTKQARAGGFHESSYELKSGLEVNESEWPDEITIPGALGER